MSTDWATLLASSDRRGGSSGARTTPPTGLIWNVALPAAIRSSPILDDGVVYVTSRDGRLYAFDAATGKPRWTFRAGAASDSTPAISGALVLFGADDGALYAIDRSSGRERWKVKAGGPI